MIDQPWWWWIAQIIGAVTFIAIVVDFIAEKRKIPRYIIAISIIAFGWGFIKGWIWYQKIIDAIGVACMWFFFAFIMCYSAIVFFSIEERRKNRKTETGSDNLSSK